MTPLPLEIGFRDGRADTVLRFAFERPIMRRILESDTGFYYAVGAFTVAIFVIGLAVVGVTNPDAIGTRELVGFVVGFFLFVLVYFVSVSVHRLEGGDGV